jgi:hypothetical protein
MHEHKSQFYVGAQHGLDVCTPRWGRLCHFLYTEKLVDAHMLYQRCYRVDVPLSQFRWLVQVDCDQRAFGILLHLICRV